MGCPEEGCYNRLLDYQWLAADGYLPADEQRLRKISKWDPRLERLGYDFGLVLACFPAAETPSGPRRANEKLRDLWEQADHRSEERARSGRAGAMARWSESDSTGEAQSSIGNGSVIAEPSESDSKPIAPGAGAGARAQGKGKGKVSSDLGSSKETPRAREVLSDVRVADFRRFKGAYPKGHWVNPRAAAKAWDRLARSGELPAIEAIEAKLAELTRSPKWRDGYVPHPATWLNGGGWESAAEPEARPTVATTASERRESEMVAHNREMAARRSLTPAEERAKWQATILDLEARGEPVLGVTVDIELALPSDRARALREAALGDKVAAAELADLLARAKAARAPKSLTIDYDAGQADPTNEPTLQRGRA